MNNRTKWINRRANSLAKSYAEWLKTTDTISEEDKRIHIYGLRKLSEGLKE